MTDSRPEAGDLAHPEQTHSPEYNRGWAAGQAAALDACNPVIERLQQALRVAAHKPHDQLGEPNEGFPVCSVCGAIQTDRPEAGDLAEPQTEAGREMLGVMGRPWTPGSVGFEGMVGEYARPAILRIEQEAAALAAAKPSPSAPALDVEPRLRPCHVTGEHEPDHHLRHDGVCSLQARDVADQMLAGRDLRTLPRELHPDCYWCGTKPMGGTYTPKASEQASWAALAPATAPTEELR